MPQSRVETVDPRTLHLTGEFIESNLGSAVEPDGSVTVRAIGQQYSFTPSCILLPTDTPIMFRATSADVVHGFLIEGTNINLMLVPGYISSLTARFEEAGERLMPCHEFCGIGHEGMWARIRVVDKAAFARMAAAAAEAELCGIAGGLSSRICGSRLPALAQHCCSANGRCSSAAHCTPGSAIRNGTTARSPPTARRWPTYSRRWSRWGLATSSPKKR